MKKPLPTPIERAIAAVGKQNDLANAIGRSQQIVSYWKRRKVIPAEAVPAIEAATGIPRHELRPDLYEASA